MLFVIVSFAGLVGLFHYFRRYLSAVEPDRPSGRIGEEHGAPIALAGPGLLREKHTVQTSHAIDSQASCGVAAGGTWCYFPSYQGTIMSCYIM